MRIISQWSCVHYRTKELDCTEWQQMSNWQSKLPIHQMVHYACLGWRWHIPCEGTSKQHWGVLEIAHLSALHFLSEGHVRKKSEVYIFLYFACDLCRNSNPHGWEPLILWLPTKNDQICDQMMLRWWCKKTHRCWWCWAVGLDWAWTGLNETG